MTDAAEPTRALAPAEQRQIHRVENLQPMLDSNRFEHFQRAASALMHSTILNPSIRGNSPQQCFSNLMLVFDLSDRWKLPALSIAQCITIVHDKVVYEGKLITAMLQATLGVSLDFHYTGERGTEGYRIYVSDRPFAELSDEDLAKLKPDVYPRGWRMIDGCVADWKTTDKGGKNNPAWTGAAQRNQLAYRGSREWTRLYEPAQLLGVYGDDEIDTMQARMDRARDVTPAAPAPSLASFRSAPAAAQPAEPDLRTFEDLKAAADLADKETQLRAAAATDHDPATGEVVAGPQEGGQDGQVAPAGTTEPAAAHKAPDAEKPAPAKRTPKQQKVVDDRAKALEKAQAIGLGARDAAAWGYDGELLDLMGGQAKWDALTAEEQGFASNGWAEGRKALQDEMESAYAAGGMGVAQLPTPDWLTPGDKSAERRWALITDEHKRGLADRAAEREPTDPDAPDAVDSDFEGEDDATTGDDALDAVRQAEPEMVDQAIEDHGFPGDPAAVDAIEAWTRALPDLSDWPAIKASMNALSKTDAWDRAVKEAPARIAEVRRQAWLREAELINAGQDRMDFINDLTAFRCWIETTSDEDAINGNWQTLVRQPIYTGLAEGPQKGLQAAVLARIEQIRTTPKT
jgi:hypothetical protein